MIAIKEKPNGGSHVTHWLAAGLGAAPAEMPATENDTVRASHVSLPRGGEKPPNAKVSGDRPLYGRASLSTDGLCNGGKE